MTGQIRRKHVAERLWWRTYYKLVGGTTAVFKRLVLAPHPDDEVLWVYSALGRGTKVMVFSDLETRTVSEQVVRTRGGVCEVLDFPNTEFPAHFSAIRAAVEQEVEAHPYDEIYYPAATAHQDHLTIHQVGQIVARPKAGRFRRVYEYPYWGHEQFPYNVVRPAPGKLDSMDRFVAAFPYVEAWTDYVRMWNLLVAQKHGWTPGTLAEPLHLVYGEGV